MEGFRYGARDHDNALPATVEPGIDCEAKVAAE